jgi:uncharacterized membrane protein
MKAWVLLVGSAGLFPVLGGLSKMEDRMASNAPHSLDGMAYMDYSSYTQNERPMDLSQDARAIRWMQQNVAGSPVIVEAATGEYNWGSRYSINTGLPDVIGWNWHQRQQRAVTPDTWVYHRIMEVGSFYATMDRGEVEGFLRRYDVRYIVVGQLERDLYSPAGLEKFDAWNGRLWDAVYRDDQTVIYKVKQ